MPAKSFPAELVAIRAEFGASDDKPAWAVAHESVLSAIFAAMQAWNKSGRGNYFYDLRDIACEQIEITKRSQTWRSGEVRLCCALFLRWLDD